VKRVTGDTSLQAQILETLSDARSYRHWLSSLVRPYLGDDPIEIGSGNGDYALELASDVKRFTCTDGDSERCAQLNQQFAEHPVIRARQLFLPTEETDNHTSAVAFNVLEHIPDDVDAVRSMARLVRPGGAVVLVVPAFPSAMSQFDLAIGHERRYTRATMRDVLLAADLDIEVLRYINPIGLIGWYVTVKALRMTPRDGLLLRAYDRTVVPMARLLDKLRVRPFGQSVFAVARVKA
jgi:SAM-dependent methyltransferase